jgi:hypothetical protein
MKKILLCTSFLFATLCSFSQNNTDVPESVKPTFDVIVKRNVTSAIINGNFYTNIITTFKAADVFDWSEGVKVIVRDELTNKKVYKKRFSKSYLYVYSDNSIQIGKGNATTEIVCFKSKNDGTWKMEIDEGGIY